MRKVNHIGLTVSSSIIQIKLAQSRLEMDFLSINLTDWTSRLPRVMGVGGRRKVLKEIYLLQASLALWLKAKFLGKASSTPTPGKRASYFYVKTNHGEFHIMELPPLNREITMLRKSLFHLFLLEVK